MWQARTSCGAHLGVCVCVRACGNEERGKGQNREAPHSQISQIFSIRPAQKRAPAPTSRTPRPPDLLANVESSTYGGRLRKAVRRPEKGGPSVHGCRERSGRGGRRCSARLCCSFPLTPSPPPPPHTSQPPAPAGIVIQTPSDALMEAEGIAGVPGGSRRSLNRAGSGAAASVRSGGPSREGSLRRGRAFSPGVPVQAPPPEEERGKIRREGATEQEQRGAGLL